MSLLYLPDIVTRYDKEIKELKFHYDKRITAIEKNYDKRIEELKTHYDKKIITIEEKLRDNSYFYSTFIICVHFIHECLLQLGVFLFILTMCATLIDYVRIWLF
tara:strand:- start:1764 stop:2075 length:312 start_codon:yes stop_codon:yes gene_type:complete